MSSVKLSRPSTLLWALGLLLLFLLCGLLVALIVRSSGIQLFGLPASVGLPTAVPVAQRDVPAPPEQPVPTVAPPTAQEQVVPTVAPPAPPPQPTAAPPPGAIVFPNDVEPFEEDRPGDPATIQGDAGGSVEPFEEGSSAAVTGTSASRGSARTGSVQCGVRVYHTARPGENLFRIALRYNTTISSIARRNGIRDTRLVRAGQRLTIVTCR